MGFGLCVRRGKENGEIFSQGLIEGDFFLVSVNSLKAENSVFLSLYPKCLAYCKSSINRYL